MVSPEIIAGSFFLALFKLVIGLALSIGSIYLGIHVLDKLTRNIDEWKEIKKGNFAVGILLGGVVLAIAVVIEGGVRSALSVLTLSLSFQTMSIALLIAMAKLVLALLSAIFSVYIAIKFVDISTPDLDEMAELKKGNIAVAILMATVLIAVAFVIRVAVEGIMDLVSLFF